jgi:hypothetical protein
MKKVKKRAVAVTDSKHFPGSLDYFLMPDCGLMEQYLVYNIGAARHGANSWRKGMPWSKCLAKAMRHLGRFLDGESRCPVDGQHHLASVCFWMNALMEYEQTKPTLDDIRKGK